ncbi:hypothetical protein CCACVL1_06131 [Corchorus capsularis]|uniref:Uncharacterized protein n=1 Tax=Corchorus capsularis TaxID=210143 RepID=A0A1R3JH81_COCAP|nr:hypothetical protein CCACVL1_06131 [Corchorus capsularis]
MALKLRLDPARTRPCTDFQFFPPSVAAILSHSSLLHCHQDSRHQSVTQPNTPTLVTAALSSLGEDRLHLSLDLVFGGVDLVKKAGIVLRRLRGSTSEFWSLTTVDFYSDMVVRRQIRLGGDSEKEKEEGGNLGPKKKP